MRDNADIEEALDRFGDAVLRACAAILSERCDAEDAFQDTFVKYATTDTRFADDEHRKAWLIRVGINTARDKLRRAARDNVSLEAVEDPVHEGESAHVIQSLDMNAALAQLSADQRLAVLLSVVEGYPAAEISRMMGKPEGTVYSLVSRGKQKLKEVLGNGQH